MCLLNEQNMLNLEAVILLLSRILCAFLVDQMCHEIHNNIINAIGTARTKCIDENIAIQISQEFSCTKKHE